MATVHMSDVENLVDKEPVSRPLRVALEFLEVFEPERPLDQEDLEEWIQITSLSADEVKAAAREALHQGWIEEASDGLRLTAIGRRRTKE